MRMGKIGCVYFEGEYIPWDDYKDIHGMLNPQENVSSRELKKRYQIRNVFPENLKTMEDVLERLRKEREWLNVYFW